MTSATPITDAERQQILELHAAGMSRNDIVRETGRSSGAVTKVVHAAGLTFDRTATEAATKAKKADAAALRAQLELDYLSDAQHLRKRIRSEYLVFEWGGKDHEYAEKTISEPPPTEQLKLMQASVAAANASLRIEAARADGGATAARSLIGDLAAAFGFQPTDTDG